MLRKNYLVLLFVVFAMSFLHAQAPQSFTYQGVACGSNGAELTNQDISVKYTIIKGSPNGTPVYLEESDIQTDAFGLFVVNVGEGGNSSSGNFSTIDWGDGPYFLKVDMDVDQNGNYATLATSQILSVPYSLYSANAGNADTSNVALRAIVADSAINDHDTDSLNEIQTIEYVDGILSISGGNSFALSLDDADANPTNEIQTISFDGENLILTASGGATNSVSLFEGPFTRPGANFAFPQGIVGDYKTITDNSYTVPVGKVLYITASDQVIDLPAFNSSVYTAPSMPVLGSGTIIKNCNCSALLVDDEIQIEEVILDFNTMNNYVVPAGKTFFLKSGFDGLENMQLVFNGQLIRFERPNAVKSVQGLIFESGTLIEVNNPSNGTIFTGYLINN